MPTDRLADSLFYPTYSTKPIHTLTHALLIVPHPPTYLPAYLPNYLITYLPTYLAS